MPEYLSDVHLGDKAINETDTFPVLRVYIPVGKTIVEENLSALRNNTG